MMDATSTLATLEQIALVDDNEYDNEYTEIILGKAGYTGRVLVFLSGEAALGALRAGGLEVDLILLDINMPGMDGFEFAEQLGAYLGGCSPAVVLLTSSSDPSDARRAASIGIIRAVVTKPLTPASVVELVARVAATFRSTADAGPLGDAADEPSDSWSLSRRLRARTQDAHRDVEHRLDLDRLLTGPADLAALLRGWSGIWSEVADGLREPWAFAPGRAELEPCADEALAWLHADLEDLADLGAVSPAAGYPDTAPGVRALGMFTRPAGIWGVGYVLRGARLGGRLLAPRISAALALPAGIGTRYLTSSGTDPARDWAAFRRRIDAWALTSAAEAEAVVDDALATFRWVGEALAASVSRPRPGSRVPSSLLDLGGHPR